MIRMKVPTYSEYSLQLSLHHSRPGLFGRQIRMPCLSDFYSRADFFVNVESHPILNSSISECNELQNPAFALVRTKRKDPLESSAAIVFTCGDAPYLSCRRERALVKSHLTLRWNPSSYES